MNHPFHGPKIVRRSLRPPRVVYIVETLDHCEAAIERCTMSWGGKYFCIIPNDPASGISEEWLRIFDSYDPDTVFTFAELDAGTKSKLARHEVTYTRVDDTEIPSRSIYAVLRNWIYSEKYTTPPEILVAKHTGDFPQRLFAMARFGFIREEPTFRMLGLLQREGLNHELKLSDIARIRYTDENEDLLTLERSRKESWGSPMSLLEHTRRGLRRYGTARGFGAQDNEFHLIDQHGLIFVSDGVSIEDFCWYWNLRAQRLDFLLLPLWMPLQYVEDRVEELKQLLPQEQFLPQDGIFVISRSVLPDKLERLAKRLDGDVEVITDRLERFFDKDFFVGIKDEYEAVFDQGRATIPLPTLSKPLDFLQSRGPFYVDVQLPNYKLPRIKANIWGTLGPSGDFRVTRSGLSFWHYLYSNRITLDVPTPWQILETIAKVHGYQVALSDKGRMAAHLVWLLGDEWCAWILSGEKVYKLFGELANISQAREFKKRLGEIAKAASQNCEGIAPEEFMQRVIEAITDERHDRTVMQSSGIAEMLGIGKEMTEQFVAWLLHRRILFRLCQIKCPICFTVQWLRLEDLQTSMVCLGCQQTIDTPLDIGTTTWKYRVNRLYASAHEHGIVPHLLTAWYFGDRNLPDLFGSNAIIGTWHGLRFNRKEAQPPHVRDIEVDVAWIGDGYLVLGECKTHWRDLKLTEVQRLLDFGREVGCKFIIFAALDDAINLPADVSEFLKEPPLEVKILHRDDLLNQYPGRYFMEQKSDAKTLTAAEHFNNSLKGFFD